MELNAEQIKKALEQSIRVSTALDYEYPSITYSKLNDALALINSQEQRIGAQDMTISELRKRVEKAEHDADRYAQRIKELTEDFAEKVITLVEFDKQIQRLTEENERLKARVLEENHLRHQSEEMLAQGMSVVKADTVRKMQERLKIHFGTYVLGYKIPLTETLKIIDQIAKEMVEGISNDNS